MPPPLFSPMHVRQMNLHLRYFHRFQSVVQSVRVVGPRAGVDDEPVGVRRFPYETDHLALGVRLPELEIQVRKLVPDELLYVVEGHGSVDIGTAGAEGAQVHTIQDEDSTQRPLLSPGGLPDPSRARS